MGYPKKIRELDCKGLIPARLHQPSCQDNIGDPVSTSKWKEDLKSSGLANINSSNQRHEFAYCSWAIKPIYLHYILLDHGFQKSILTFCEPSKALGLNSYIHFM